MKHNRGLRKYLPLLIILIAVAARIVPGPRTVDDAYISFRYARNILAGEGFVFNPGERVQGTTTPLYTLLMAGVGALTGGPGANFPMNAMLVNTAADALACLLLIRLGRRLGAAEVGLAAALLWAVAPHSVTFAIGGLETSLYVLLLTGAVCAYTENRNTLAALFAALAILTRPDAVLLAVPLILDRLIRAARGGAKLRTGELAAFLLPTLGWAVFAWLYFGSPIPHSVSAKLAVYRLEPGSSLVRLLQHYTAPFQERNLLGGWFNGVGLVLYPFLYSIGALKACRTEKRLLAWAVYPWLYMAAFSLPNPLIFRWYLTPPLPPYYFFILLGAATLLKAGFNRLEPLKPAVRKALTAAVLLLPVAIGLAAWTFHPENGPDRPAPQMASIELEELYRQAALIMNPAPSEMLAAGDVGVLGYYTSARILDTVGLNSPQSLGYYPIDPALYVINYAIPSALIRDNNPDRVAILEVYGRRTLLEDPAFLNTYSLEAALPTEMYGSRGLLIFKNKIR
jgi:hypothetical protein